MNKGSTRGAKEEPWQAKEKSDRNPVDSGPAMRLGLESFPRTGQARSSTRRYVKAFRSDY
jgi:hypothetical protein